MCLKFYDNNYNAYKVDKVMTKVILCKSNQLYHQQ